MGREDGINKAIGQIRLPQWSRSPKAAERGEQHALPKHVILAAMEPQPDGCGERFGGNDAPEVWKPQWSRSLRAAESGGADSVRRPDGATAMEPQPESCGEGCITRVGLD